MSGLKPKLQRLLMRTGFYHRVRKAFIYDLYWLVVDRRVIESRTKQVRFYENLLRGFQNRCLVFDIGANHGTKTDIFLRLGARVIAVDPDETNQQALKEAFLQYRVNPRAVTIIGKAVSDKVATETLWIDEPGSAKNTLSPKWVQALRNDKNRFGHQLRFGEAKQIETTTLDQLIEAYGAPFFIKIDVEGHELSVLRGLRCPVPYVSFEVNLPDFLEEGLRCVELLQRLAKNGRFNYTVDCERGVALDRWLEAASFSAVLADCTEKSIEVLWESGLKP